MIILRLIAALTLVYAIFSIIKKNSGLRFHPLSVFASIWIMVIWGTCSTIQFKVPFENVVYFAILIFASGITIFLCSYMKSIDHRCSCVEYQKTICSNYRAIKITLILCILFRILQLFYDLYIVKKLGGTISVVFGDAQWLRQAYLSYSSDAMPFGAKLVSNILNYFAEFGIIIAALLSYYEKKYFSVVLTLFFSLLHAVFTMSKMSFFMDICYVVSCFEVLINVNSDSRAGMSSLQQKKENKKMRRMFLIIGIGAIVLLGVVSMQRGYGTGDSFAKQLSTTFSKAITYLVTPTMAFFKVLDMNIDLSWGTKTFNVFFKLLGYEFSTFGAIDVGTEDSTVYTMSGMFYADFGMIGGLVLTVLFIILCSKIYIKVLNKFSIPGLSLFISLNTILMMSFFTWMGRITFFWTFPIFISIYSKFFFRRGENNV